MFEPLVILQISACGPDVAPSVWLNENVIIIFLVQTLHEHRSTRAPFFFPSHVHTLSDPALNFPDDSHTLSWMHATAHFQGRRPMLSSEQAEGSTGTFKKKKQQKKTNPSARRLMDVRLHYMHQGLNTVLPLMRTPFCPHINGYGLQHVITVIGSLWGRSSPERARSEMLGCGAA